MRLRGGIAIVCFPGTGRDGTGRDGRGGEGGRGAEVEERKRVDAARGGRNKKRRKLYSNVDAIFV